MPRLCGSRLPVYYYCSDDYADYAGWGGQQVKKAEHKLVGGVAHSFFVSRVLAERAISNYKVSADRVSVSPNATGKAFLQQVPAESMQELLGLYPRLRRPLLGVVGGVNDRLDFDLLEKCLDLPELGSLVIVGPVHPGLVAPGWERIKRHSKCVITGARPHRELPAWMQMLDVALIPYRDTPLNRACSPMRLFDHLAAGQPIVATHHCQQIIDYAAVVEVGGSILEVLQLLKNRLNLPSDGTGRETRLAIARQNTWEIRAASMRNILQND